MRILTMKEAKHYLNKDIKVDTIYKVPFDDYFKKIVSKAQGQYYSYYRHELDKIMEDEEGLIKVDNNIYFISFEDIKDISTISIVHCPIKLHSDDVSWLELLCEDEGLSHYGEGLFEVSHSELSTLLLRGMK